MAAASELTGEKEILFPEIAAIAAGAFAAPKMAWNTSYARMFLLLAAGAVTGTLLVLIPLPPAVQMSLAFLAASLMLAVSRTTFAPMISAIVLPVMLQTRSVVYPVSAAILSASVIAVRMLLQKRGLLEAPDYQPEPMPDAHKSADLLLRWMLGSCVIVLAVLSGQKLIAAPPLLVAFTEFWKPGARAQRQPMRVSLLIASCALIGTAMRISAVYLGFYQFPAAGLTLLLVLLVMRRTGMLIPPAAALSVLAFLIPAESLLRYPLLILAGALIFTCIAAVHGRLAEQRRIYAEERT
jgi:hypothetical protein